MSPTLETVQAIAPDQASLNAANKLMKPAKWPILTQGETLVWGECQGSGANPYRTVFDRQDNGYKCTCPSRKFPCKHVLALMWMYAEDPAPFTDGAVPDWVTDWLGRRRKTGAAAQSGSGAGKSLTSAKSETISKDDPEAAARRAAAAQKRAAATQAALEGAVADLEAWIADQMRTGFAVLLDDLSDRCRTIAARLVDGKAQALAGRLDQLPATLMARTGEARVDALVQELGRIILLCRAWSAAPEDPELRRLIATAETRETVLTLPDTTRHAALWDVVGEQITTRRDGLVAQTTWLMSLDHVPRFAQLLDFFPAASGKRESPFAVGAQFEAEVAFYPARVPLRAVLATRGTGDTYQPWPERDADPMATYADALRQAPWLPEMPLLLPSGRFGKAGADHWWIAEGSGLRLPLSQAPDDYVSGMDLGHCVGLWDGLSFAPLSAQSSWGRISF